MTRLSRAVLQNDRESGFTLAEILVTAALLSIIAAGLLAVLKAADLSWNLDSGMLDLQQTARQAMDATTKEIRQSAAEDITISAGQANIRFLIPIDITAVPPTYSGYINYSLNNNQLIREHPAGTERVVANNIANLTFCCIGTANCTQCSGASMLKVQLQASKAARNRILSFSLTEEVKLRNE